MSRNRKEPDRRRPFYCSKCDRAWEELPSNYATGKRYHYLVGLHGLRKTFVDGICPKCNHSDDEYTGSYEKYDDPSCEEIVKKKQCVNVEQAYIVLMESFRSFLADIPDTYEKYAMTPAYKGYANGVERARYNYLQQLPSPDPDFVRDIAIACITLMKKDRIKGENSSY